MIPTQTFESYPTFGDNATKIAPDNAKMSAGFQPADTLPAEWMNWAWNKNSKGIQDHNDGLSSVEAEINNILSENGITPSEADNTQFFKALQKYGAFIMASSTTITGPNIDTGSVIRIMFTTDVTGSDAVTGLLISYNGSNKAVKVGKDGALEDFVAKQTGTSTYKYIQAYTTLEFMYDGTNFIIVGNPIVVSSSTYIYHADGFNEYAIDDKVGTSYKGKTYGTTDGNFVLTLPRGSFLVLISGMGYSNTVWELDLIICSGTAFSVRQKLAGGSTNPVVTVNNNTISAKHSGNYIYIYATQIGNNWYDWT